MHIEQKSFPRYFSATTGWNLTQLHVNLQNQAEMCISTEENHAVRYPNKQDGGCSQKYVFPFFL
jgi:hypothetical protein